MDGQEEADALEPLSDVVRRLRRVRRLTQTQLASNSKISLRTIQDLETGKTQSPQFHTLERLAAILAVSDSDRAALFGAARPSTRDSAGTHLPEEQSQAAQKEAGAADAVRSASSTRSTPPAPSTSPGSARKLRPRLLVAGAALAAVVGTSLAVAAIVTQDDSSSGETPLPATTSAVCSSPPMQPTSSSPVPSTGYWQATVVGTWSSSRCKDLGVRPRVSPVRGEKVYPGFFTGTTVFVRCYYSRGVEIRDKDSGESSTVWYQLEDGHYLSGTFLRINQRSAMAPPTGMPPCQVKKPR